MLLPASQGKQSLRAFFWHTFTLYCDMHPLLSNNCKISSYTTAVVKYKLYKEPLWLGNHRNSNECNNKRVLGDVFSTLFVPRYYEQGRVSDHRFQEADKNTSTVIPASRKRRRKGNAVVSDETVMYGYESSATLTTDRLHYKYRPVLSSERAPQDEEQSNFLAKERKR
jgi:hypothetical protein